MDVVGTAPHVGAQAQPFPVTVSNSLAGMLRMDSQLGLYTLLRYVSLSHLQNCATSRLGGGTNTEGLQLSVAVTVPHVCSGSTIDGVAQSLHEQS